MDYQRHLLCPEVTTYDAQGKPEYKLDYLSAPYLTIPKINTHQIYLVEDAMAAHPELISNKFYNTVDLWWVICLYNGIIDPITEIYSGVVLKIPSLKEVQPLVNSTKTPINTTKIVMVN